MTKKKKREERREKREERRGKEKKREEEKKKSSEEERSFKRTGGTLCDIATCVGWSDAGCEQFLSIFPLPSTTFLC